MRKSKILNGQMCCLSYPGFMSKILIINIGYIKNRVFQYLNLSIYAEFHADFESGNDLLISLEKTAFISKILSCNFPFFQFVFGPGPHEAPLAPIFNFFIFLLPIFGR